MKADATAGNGAAAADSASPPACIWCGRPFDEKAVRLIGRTRCPSCGAATTDPWPTPAELDEAYSTWYRPEAGRFSGVGDKILSRTRGRLAKWLDRAAPPGRVLDVGAGDGSLLDAIQARGREAIGLELVSRRDDVLEKDVTELDGEWSAIVFWHSLEHLPEPGPAIDAAIGLLAPGGVLIVAVPNEESWQARAFDEHWFALDLPRHLVHLPASTLAARLAERGLTIQKTSFTRGGQILFGWLYGLVDMLPGNLNLYDAIRRPEARSAPMTGPQRIATLFAGTVFLPLGILASLGEVASRRGGTVYIEARRG